MASPCILAPPAELDESSKGFSKAADMMLAGRGAV